MRTILLSFKPNVYERIATGEKIFEYRRSFPEGQIKAYMYVSSPVCAIKGILYFGKRHRLVEWKEEFASDQDAVARINEYLKNVNYGSEITEFQQTNEISLKRLRDEVDGFVVPQMYYYIDEKKLEKYLKENIKATGQGVEHRFAEIKSEQVCIH